VMVGVHSRARRSASAIWAAVMLAAALSRFLTASEWAFAPSSDDPRLNCAGP